jgi:hypothetical protein
MSLVQASSVKMLAARFALGCLMIAAAAVASVSIGIDRWTMHTADTTFLMTGLRRSCGVNGCTRNDYNADVTTLGNCTKSLSTFEELNDAAWALQIAAVAVLGAGALFMVGSSFRGLGCFVVSIAVTLVGAVGYVVGGGIAYNTHNDWLYCGLTFCDNYYAAGGLRCVTEQGPSFALWCIAIAVAGSGFTGALWFLAADVAKAKMLKKSLPRGERRSGQPSVSRESRAMSPREPVRAPTTSIVVPAGFHYQPESGLYFSDAQNTFFDQRNGHYFSAEHNSWYNPDTKQWYIKEEHVSPAVAPGMS